MHGIHSDSREQRRRQLPAYFATLATLFDPTTVLVSAWGRKL